MPKAATKGQATRTEAKKATSPYPHNKHQKKQAKVHASVFEKKPRNFSIGGALQPARDVTRFVKWPAYIKLQRQKRVLQHRLKTPPLINQFTKTLDKNHALTLFKLLHKYRPETKQQRAARLKAVAEAKAASKEAAPATTKPLMVKSGLNHVTTLVEQKKAKLVVIAHDVDPIELVLWLPALCRRSSVPYVIVKSKSRLGNVVHKKTATALAITNVSKDDANELAKIVAFAKDEYNDKYDETRRQSGGGRNGIKSTVKMSKRAKAHEKEQKMAQKIAV